MKHSRTIRRHLKDLRKLIDSSEDKVVRRIAYAMEVAVLWATTETVGWSGLAREAIEEAETLREELR